jgi:hypothetical protein
MTVDTMSGSTRRQCPLTLPRCQVPSGWFPNQLESDPNAEVKVDLETKRVAIDSTAELAQLAEAIENAGYLVEAA